MGLRRQRKREKREFDRAEATVLARLSSDRGDYRTVLDISRGGLRMKTRVPVKENDWVPVRLFFPSLTEEVEITGRVAWIRRSGEVGIDYRDLDGDDAGLLKIMIDHQDVLSGGLN